MKVRSVNVVIMMLFASVVLISCGGNTGSALESMKAPIHVVRNDSVTEVKDSKGELYVLNGVERTDYRAAFLKPGDELQLSATQ